MARSATKAEAALTEAFAAAGLDWVVPDWPAPSHVRAFSTTRHGGNGTSFDLGSSNDRLDRASSELLRWLPSEPIWLTQVHGARVHVVEGTQHSATARNRPSFDAAAAAASDAGAEDPDAPRHATRDSAPQADAIVTRMPNVVCAVRSADCLPVLFCDGVGSVVAAAHAGWRGLSAGVLEATVAAMRVHPAELMAWMGPAIGPTRFEVGTDVVTAFGAARAAEADAFVPLGGGKWHANLYALARSRLHSAGVTAVYGGGACTYDDAQRYYSYRRARDVGRMASLVWRTP